MSPNKPLQVRLLGDNRALVVLSDEEYNKMIERQQRRWETRNEGEEFAFMPNEDMVFRLASEISNYQLELINETEHIARQLHEEEIEEELGITDVMGVSEEVSSKLIDAGYYLAEKMLDVPLETLAEKSGLPLEVLRQTRRLVSSYFQDFKIADVVDLPRAYKEALMVAGYIYVEDFLNARSDEAIERTGLTEDDLVEVMRYPRRLRQPVERRGLSPVRAD